MIEYFSIIQNQIVPTQKTEDFFLQVLHEAASKLSKNIRHFNKTQLSEIKQLREVKSIDNLPQFVSLSDGISIRYIPIKSELLLQLRDPESFIHKDETGNVSLLVERIYELSIRQDSPSGPVILTEGVGMDVSNTIIGGIKAIPKISNDLQKVRAAEMQAFIEYCLNNSGNLSTSYEYFQHPITYCCDHFSPSNNNKTIYTFTLEEYQKRNLFDFESFQIIDKDRLELLTNIVPENIFLDSKAKQQVVLIAIDEVISFNNSTKLLQSMIQRADCLRSKLNSRFRQVSLKKAIDGPKRKENEISALQAECNEKEQLLQKQQSQLHDLRSQLSKANDTVRSLSTKLEVATKPVVSEAKEAEKNNRISALEKELKETQRLLSISQSDLTTERLINEHLSDKLSRPSRLADVAEWIQKQFEGKIVLHSRAVKLLNNANPSNVDIDILCDAVEYLAEEYRDCLLQKISPEDLSHICSVKYNRPFRVKVTGDEYMTKSEYNIYYNGENRFMNLHFLYGCSTEALIRIYFFYDKKEKSIVIGSLPYHLPCLKIKA